MTPDRLFSIANSLALVSWILLAALGWKPRIARAITGFGVPLLLSFLYLLLVVGHWGEHSGGFSSLPQVAQLFQNQWLLLAGWVHYLAFDLFIGSWEVRDAAKHGIRHWIVLPALLLTFMFGPIGLLLYLAIRTVAIRTKTSTKS